MSILLNILKDATPTIIKNRLSHSNSWGSSTGRSFGYSDGKSNVVDNNQQILDNLINAYKSSALKLEKQSTLEARQWQAQREDLAWNRSQQSAREQMEFQKQQSDLAWNRSQQSAREQMEFQQKMFGQALDYETEMSNTAIQRRVNDLRQAGMNPILAVTQGGASVPNASVPAGASSSAQSMSGASASYSANSGAKADYSSAISTDKKIDALGLFTSLFTSALKTLLK